MEGDWRINTGSRTRSTPRGSAANMHAKCAPEGREHEMVRKGTLNGCKGSQKETKGSYFVCFCFTKTA